VAPVAPFLPGAPAEEQAENIIAIATRMAMRTTFLWFALWFMICASFRMEIIVVYAYNIIHRK
jgi:hypothetical protein